MTNRSLTGKRGKKSRRVRLEDVAKICNVSLSTVSRALSGEKGVQSKTRERILEVARKINYLIPKSVDGKKIILAVSTAAMIDHARNQFSLYVLDGLTIRAEELNISIVTYPVTNAEEAAKLVGMVSKSADILGVLSLTVDDESILSALRDLGTPVVLINSVDSQMRLSSVTPSNRFGARVAAEHLLQLGHRRILFLMRPGRDTIAQRLLGWRDALHRFGVMDEGELVVEVEDWLPELAGQAVEARIRERGLDFTAILAAGDSLAIGAMLELRRQDIPVPDAVSVVGMDDLPQVAFMTPPLTTMHIPMREMGAAAINLLQSGVSSNSLPPCRIELACRLVERSSTAPVRNGE